MTAKEVARDVQQSVGGFVQFRPDYVMKCKIVLASSKQPAGWRDLFHLTAPCQLLLTSGPAIFLSNGFQLG